MEHQASSTSSTASATSSFTCKWINKAKSQWTNYQTTKALAKHQATMAKCESAEKQLLSMNGVTLGQDYIVQNTHINSSNAGADPSTAAKLQSIHEQQYLHSYRSMNQSPDKKNIVLLHGYGMNGLAYMKMLTALQSKYNVHCLDLPGMGLSSRDDFSGITNEKETLDYFVNAIEAYRKDQRLKNFILVGHSFGGFIGANYAMRHAESVQNLVLLSPLGCTHRSDAEIKQQYDEIINRGGLTSRLMMRLYLNLFKKETTLQSANLKWYLPVKTLMSKYFQAGLNLSEEQMEVYQDFALNMLDLKESSDKGLYKIIKEGSVFVKTPLEQSLSEKLNKKIPVHFLFGDKDWMDYQGAYRLFRNQKETGMNVNFTLLQHTRHQMTIDNPKEITNYLLNL